MMVRLHQHAKFQVIPPLLFAEYSYNTQIWPISHVRLEISTDRLWPKHNKINIYNKLVLNISRYIVYQCDWYEYGLLWYLISWNIYIYIYIYQLRSVKCSIYPEFTYARFIEIGKEDQFLKGMVHAWRDQPVFFYFCKKKVRIHSEGIGDIFNENSANHSNNTFFMIWNVIW